MAKIAYSKFGLKKLEPEIKMVAFNQQQIEVKSYLPVQQKLQLISDVINESADANRFYNPVKVSLFFTVEVLKYYTNITFTAKQLEDIPGLYDIVHYSGLEKRVMDAIPDEEIFGLKQDLDDCVKAIYAQMNSAYGIMESIANDYNQMNMDATEINEKLSNPRNLTLLKDVMNKLG